MLFTSDNPGYKDIIEQHHNLKGVEMDDVDMKRELQVQPIQGASE